MGTRQNWLGKRGSIWMQIKRELARVPIFGRPFDTNADRKQGFGVQWETLTRPGAPLFSISGLQAVPEPASSQQRFHDIASTVDGSSTSSWTIQRLPPIGSRVVRTDCRQVWRSEACPPFSSVPTASAMKSQTGREAFLPAWATRPMCW